MPREFLSPALRDIFHCTHSCWMNILNSTKFSQYQRINKQSFLTQIDNILGPEGGVTMEADGSVGSGDGIAPSLQDVPQLECYLRQNKNSAVTQKRTMRNNKCVSAHRVQATEHQQGLAAAGLVHSLENSQLIRKIPRCTNSLLRGWQSSTVTPQHHCNDSSETLRCLHRADPIP